MRLLGGVSRRRALAIIKIGQKLLGIAGEAGGDGGMSGRAQSRHIRKLAENHFARQNIPQNPPHQGAFGQAAGDENALLRQRAAGQGSALSLMPKATPSMTADAS